MKKKVSSAYIHIPFCTHICNYCDFCKVFYNEKFVSLYLKQLKKEISNRYKKEKLKTIYIGGGTPSSLSYEQLVILFNILSILKKDIDIEYTIECNIENITEDKLKLMKKNGINRISIGVESFNNKHLKYLGRKHTKEQSIEKIQLVKKYFDNINVDLMYAIKNQTIEDLNNDIDILINLDIPHISTYSLIIEDNTILKNNNTDYIDEELDYQMYKLIEDKFKNYGYIHYEISNYSKKGYESKHNLTYWNNNNYYGFGCGASGYIDNIRYDNTRSITNYLKGEYLKEENILDINTTIENEFILGLRKINGMNIDKLNKKYNINIKDIKALNKLLEENKIIIEDNNLFINPKYLYTSNDILIDFIDLNIFKLVPLKECINKEVYNMYQDIPDKEIGSINNLKDLNYEEFKLKCLDLIKEETIEDEILKTTTNRYILYVLNKPIGEIGIRTTLSDLWINKGSQIYYKICLSERNKGYGNIILQLGLIEAKKLGFKQIRINCNNLNIPSLKVILNNNGILDIKDYKTKEGYSSSYIINIK